MAIQQRPLVAALLTIVLATAACGNDAEVESAPLPSDQPAQTTTTTVAAASPDETTAPSTTTPEAGGVPVSETLDPAGAVTGGTVGRSYLADEFPQELTGIVGLALADLAERLGIDQAAISIVLVEEVVWGDGSHGCPQPGMAYTQVLTDGLRIILEADGQLYDYRSGGLSNPELCVQAVAKDESLGGLYELTPEGTVVPVAPKDDESTEPTDGLNPPDK
jgi:hypothetical protein